MAQTTYARTKTQTDFTQRLRFPELKELHAHQLLPTSEAFRVLIAVVLSDGTGKYILIYQPYDLCKNTRTIVWHMSTPVWWFSFGVATLR